MATPPTFVSGAILTAAQMNTIGTFLVASGTVTSGSSFDINGCFTSDYDSYKIILSNIRTAAASPDVQLRLISGGSAITAGYFYGMTRVDVGTGVINVVGVSGGSQWITGALAGTTSTFASFEIHSPFNTQTKSFNSTGSDQRAAGSYGGITVTGTNTSTLSCSALRVLLSSSTFTNCRYNVYGYRYS